jgi:curved DNA-binding protein CbpA
MNPKRNYYRDLLSRVLDDEPTLKKNYRLIVRRTHSDTNQGSDEYTQMFQAAVEAWEILGNARVRAEYDEARRGWIASLGAVMCSGCGEALRIRTENRKQRCPLCKTVLTVSEEQSVPSIVSPVVESGYRLGARILDATEDEAERLGRELIQRSAENLSRQLMQGFDFARQRLRRRRESR